MKYQIIGSTVPAVEFNFDVPGEALYSQSGGMSWMSDGVKMETNMKGGFGKSIGRMFAGESLFMATYTAQRPDSTVAFASTVPGEILPVAIGQGMSLICQKGSFICAQPTVNLNITFTKKFTAGLFGGEGFILQKLSGEGLAFLEIDGDRIERILTPGEVLKVDSGNVVAFEESVKYEIETVKGFKNILFGGEGLFLTKLTGPGKVILQTQNIFEFATKIGSMIPSKG